MESRTVEKWPEMGTRMTVNSPENREGRRQGEMLAGGQLAEIVFLIKNQEIWEKVFESWDSPMKI